MKRTLCLAWALAVVGASARADELTIGRIAYRDVKIRSVSADKIGFEFYGRTIYKPLEQVTRVSLSSDAEFNKAEASLAAGKLDEALAHYAAAREKAEKDWHKALIDHRLAVAKARKARPTTAPASKDGPPTTSPKGPPEGPGTKAPGEPGDPLATPESFSALLKSQPPHPNKDRAVWSKLTEVQKRLAERKHASRLTAWGGKVRRFRSKNVVWKLAFQDAKKFAPKAPPVRPRPGRTPPGPDRPSYPPPRSPRAGPSRTPRSGMPSFPRQGPPTHWRFGYVVRATSQGRVRVSANVLPTHGKALARLKRNQIIQVSGKIRRDLEPGAAPEQLYLDAARVEPAPEPEPPKAEPKPKPPAAPASPPARKKLVLPKLPSLFRGRTKAEGD